MDIQTKLYLLRKEYINASPGRKAGIIFQANVLKRALGKEFPKSEPMATYEEAVKIFTPEKDKPPVS